VPIDRAHPSDIHGVVTRHGVRQLLRPLRLPTLLWAIGVLYYFPLIRWPVGEYDEGLMVSGAARVLDGAIPYRDFWTIYAPGQFYALAGVFKLFGVSLLASRIYEVLLRASVALASTRCSQLSRIRSRFLAPIPSSSARTIRSHSAGATASLPGRSGSGDAASRCW